jgi:hypothetical protein
MRQGAFENVSFSDAEKLAFDLGFWLDRIRGSHHIYRHKLLAPSERLNLQPDSGDAKNWQLKQLLYYVQSYNLTLGDK